MLQQASFCLIEKPFIMPGNKNRGLTTQLINYGQIKAIAKLSCPYQEVAPITWKSKMHLAKQDKPHSIKVAKQYFSNLSLKRTARCKTECHNMAEAALMVAYARDYILS